MKTILFVSHSSERCGIYQFGKNTAQALSKSGRYQFCYVECSRTDFGAFELLKAIATYTPDVILYNWHPLVLPWVNDQLYGIIFRHYPNIKHLTIVHEYLDNCTCSFKWMDGYIHIDPYFVEYQNHYRVGRLIPKYQSKEHSIGKIRIGSFGFAYKDKNYKRVIEQVNAEFDHATIRLHIPYTHFVNPEKAKEMAKECQQLAKPGITIESTHQFLSQEALLDWLAQNTINCFFFDRCEGRGISSSIDYALAVKRPIAITDSYMFRHVSKTTPSIVIGHTTLKDIIDNGIRPLEKFYKEWTEENLIKDYERIMDKVLTIPKYDLTSNRVLTIEDRVNLQPVIKELSDLAPDIMKRKDPETVFQNAFIFQQAKSLAKKGDKLIIIGGYEDPIGPSLIKLGYDITITDPLIDRRDMEAVWKESLLFDIRYDMVICCSVLEHVEDDVSFIKQIYDILKPNGIAILTTDYKSNWQEGMAKPDSDCRLYTSTRLHYLLDQLPKNSCLDKANWENIEPYVTCESSNYAFCSLAFQKKESETSLNDMTKNYLYQHYCCQFEELNKLRDLQNEYNKIHPSFLKMAKNLQSIAKKLPFLKKIGKMLISRK